MKIEEAKCLICEARGILRGLTALIDSDCVDILHEAIEELNSAIIAFEDEEASDV